MNTPILPRQSETDALRGDLRLSARSPRPIRWLGKRPSTHSGGRR
jgi:hypothetical protein